MSDKKRFLFFTRFVLVVLVLLVGIALPPQVQQAFATTPTLTYTPGGPTITPKPPCTMTPTFSAPVTATRTPSVTPSPTIIGGGSLPCTLPQGPTNTPSPTAIQCPLPSVVVEPVLSPTSATSQDIRVSTNGGIPRFTITARDNGGTFLSQVVSTNTSSMSQVLTLPLIANTTHFLTVSVNAEVACSINPPMFNFMNNATIVDRNANLLMIVQTNAVTPATRTNTPTPTRLPCPTGTQSIIIIQVEPVVSPTNTTSQVIFIRTSYPSTVTVNTGFATFTAAFTSGGGSLWNYEATITLNAGATHNLTVTAQPQQIVPTSVGTPVGCPVGVPLGRSTTVDKLGNPLKIVQQSAPVPTNTMVAPLTISGFVSYNQPRKPGIPGVAGVTIRHAFGTNPLQAVATTDANGNYSFTVETNGQTLDNTMQAQKSGYTFLPQTVVFTTTGAGTQFIDFIGLDGTPTPTNTTCVCNPGGTQTAAAGKTRTAIALLTRTSTPSRTPTRTLTPSLTPTVPTRTNTPTTPTTPAPTGTLKLQYKAADTVTGDNQFKPHFNIVNTGSTAVNMSELKIRYYFTKDGGGSMVFNCDWAVKGCANLSGAFVAATGLNTDTYLEVSFTTGAGTIAAGGSSGEIQTRMNKSDWTNFNESNDYSFDPTKTAFADWNRVVLLRNGVVVWGIAP